MDNSHSSLEPKLYQNIILMRHGDRVDDFVESWRSEAARPWDPHLIDAGHSRALSTGQKLQTQLGYPIHRVFVSPFLRCVGTASSVISGLNDASNTNPTLKPSKIKASVQYGLSEILNGAHIVAPPKDGEEWGFDNLEIESLFPVGMVDQTCKQVISEMPRWEETEDDGIARFVRVIHALADEYLAQNLLLVTHGEAVRSVMNNFSSYAKCLFVEYCGYVQLRREIISMNEVEKFELVTDFNNGIIHTTALNVVD